MKDEPLASIIINNYNYGRFIGESIDSALNQTYPYTEIIVVDDGSTDNSREIIAKYKDRITSVLKENGGQTSAFNAGFASSNGDIVCMLDSDDVMLPEKIAEVVRVFQSHPGIEWYYHSLRVVDTSTNSVLRSDPEGYPSRPVDFRHRIIRAELPSFAPATSGLCFKRSLLQQIFPMPEMPERKTTSADRYLKLTALALGTGFFSSKDLAILRIHGGNAVTLRNDKRQVVARSLIMTAYWMRIKFPNLAMFTNKIFGMGIGLYWQTGGLNTQYEEISRKYLSSTPLLARCEIYIRAFYHSNFLFSSIKRLRFVFFELQAKSGKI